MGRSLRILQPAPDQRRDPFEEMESFLDAAKSIHRFFLAESSEERREVVRLVASDVTLEGGKAL